MCSDGRVRGEMNSKKILWLALLLWMFLIIVLNSIPGRDLPSAGDKSVDYFIRQGGHIFLHMILTLFAWTAAKRSFKWHWAWVLAIFISVVFSIVNEFYQAYIPGRNPNWDDVGCNLAGVFLTMCLVVYRYRSELAADLRRLTLTFLN